MAKVKSFELENYKSLKSTPKIPLDGLNIIIGENSSGKSNILESLMVLKQTIEARDLNSPLVLNGDILNLGDFSDLIYNREENRKLKYAFNIELGDKMNEEVECPVCNKDYDKKSKWFYNHIEDEHKAFYKKNKNSIDSFVDFKGRRTSKLVLSYEYRGKPKSAKLDEVKLENFSENSSIFVEELKLKNGIETVKMEIKLLNGPKIKFSSDNFEVDLENDRLTPSNYKEKMQQVLSNFIPEDERYYNAKYSKQEKERIYEHIIERNVDKEVKMHLDDEKNLSGKTKDFMLILSGMLANNDKIDESLRKYLKKISHVGPIREEPERVHFGFSGKPKEVGERGENLSNLIIHDREYSSSTESIVDKTNEWLEETGFNCSLDVENIGRSDLYEIVVEEDGLKVNITDVGFGLSQILPIIFQTIKVESKNKESEAIFGKIPGMEGSVRFNTKRPEQQATLMIEQPEVHLNPRIESKLADFFKSMLDEDLSFIIETHSEHLLSRLQRRVSEGKIKKSKINTLFVKKENNSSKIKKLEIDEGGKFKEWPSGFFQDDYEDSVEIFKNSVQKRLG